MHDAIYYQKINERYKFRKQASRVGADKLQCYIIAYVNYR